MRMSSRKLLLETPITLRWRDLDALNHVNNASFLTYFEEARLRWFATLPGPWSDAGHSPVLAAVQVNYRRQLGWPADVVVVLECEKVGHTSLTLAHRLGARADRSAIYADGTSVLVWVDPATGKPVPLPEAIVAACR
jgi:acyl-CoA thioester hydrolase